MNLLQEFEGLFGENLGTAALRVILHDNRVAREAIIDLLSDASPAGPLVSDSHFACYREFCTADESGRSGRLDLVVELDNAVIGIEAKFFAPIQPEQPTKYWPTLLMRAELLSKLRGAPGSVVPQLFLLAPEASRLTYQPFLARSSFLSWEAVAQAVARAVQLNTSSTVERDFVAFVKGKLDFLPRLDRELPHLTRTWQPKGSELQCTFLSAVYFTALGLSGGRLTRRSDWCGYYLPGESSLGFGPSQDASQLGASLFLESQNDLKLNESPFSRCVTTQPSSEVQSPVPSRFRWYVKVTPEWKDPLFVRRLFEPVVQRATATPAPAVG